MNPTCEKYVLPEDRSLVLFDGDCLLCNHSVRFIFERDADERFFFAPLQSALGGQLLEEHGLEPDQLSTMVLIENDAAHTQSDAALRIARRLTIPWRWLAVFYFVPRFIRDRVYRFVADNRYRLFGKSTACEIPSAELRERILG